MVKLILKTSLITLASIIVVLGVISLFVGVFSPVSFANLFENLGANNASMYFYVKAYERTPNINTLFAVVNKSIQFGVPEGTIKYYQILEQNYDTQYAAFMDFVNENNYTSSSGVVLNKVSVSNEDNYLKCRYVLALAQTGDIEGAFDYAVKDFYAHAGTVGGGTGGSGLPDIFGYAEDFNFVFAGLTNYLGEEILSGYLNQNADIYTILNSPLDNTHENTIIEDIYSKFTGLLAQYQAVSNTADLTVYTLGMQTKYGFLSGTSAAYLKVYMQALYISKLLEINELLLAFSENLLGDLVSTLPVGLTSLQQTQNDLLKEFQQVLATTFVG